MAEIRTIVGIKKITTKAGKAGMQIYYNEPFSDYDKENSDVVGLSTGSIYTSKVQNLIIGDQVKMYFSDRVFNGNAMLDEIVVVGPAPDFKDGKQK